MRFIILALLAFWSLAPQKAYAQTHVGLYCFTGATNPQWAPCALGTYPFQALGYQQLTGMSGSTALTVPATATVAEICVEAQGIRYRDDGVAPTGTVGMPIASGTCFQYTGTSSVSVAPLTAIRFIQQTSGAILNVSYYH